MHSDWALLTYIRDGVFHVLIASVVDDLIIAVDEKFEEEVEKN